MFTSIDQAPDDLDPTQVVLVSEHPRFPGCLLFAAVDWRGFYRRYSGWISRHQVLSELFSLGRFVELLESDGWIVLFGPSTEAILARYHRHSTPLAIHGYDLHDFQNYSLNEALTRAELADSVDRLYLFNWAAGAGKSYCAGAGIRLLFDQGRIDLAIAATSAHLKLGLARFIRQAGVPVTVNDNPKPDDRRRNYFGQQHRCFVLNFEKLRTDRQELADLTHGKRVLFVLDEAHNLLNDNEGKYNLARKSLNSMVRDCEAIVWPMTATAVDGNALRYRDVYALAGQPRLNPLGTKVDFVNRYAAEVKEEVRFTRTRRRFVIISYDWDHAKLHDVRHRVDGRVMAVRKTDKALNHVFKGMQTIPMTVSRSPAVRQLTQLILDDAEAASRAGISLAHHFQLLRMIAVTPEALAHTSNPLGRDLAAKHPRLVSAAHSTKLAALNELLESIHEAGDKAVVFCTWTNLGIHLITNHLTVPHLVHTGAMSARKADDVIEQFKNDPAVTALISSDAGSHGLNLQCCRYVISLDVPYSYDDLSQRNSRIDRADSHLDGLTAYVMITEGSVEERIWQVCDQRRQLAATISGKAETLSYTRAQKSENENLNWLVLGKEESK